jgi:hypothetical protein
MLTDLCNGLKGKKTYLVGAVTILVTGAYYAGYMDETTYKLVSGVLIGLGWMALRAGVTKAGQ